MLSACFLDYLLWVSFHLLVINEGPHHVYTHTPIYSNLVLFTDAKYELHSIDSLYKLQSKRLVTTSVSLQTQTELLYLTSQILNTRVWFLDIWYSPFTSIQQNLEHGLATITKSFSPLNLNYTTPLSKSELEVTWQAILFLILFICHVH